MLLTFAALLSLWCRASPAYVRGLWRLCRKLKGDRRALCELIKYGQPTTELGTRTREMDKQIRKLYKASVSELAAMDEKTFLQHLALLAKAKEK